MVVRQAEVTRAAVVSLFVVFVGCSSSSSNGAAVIGANGGTVTSPDGQLVLELPAGALSEDTKIEIKIVDKSVWSGLLDGEDAPITPVYELSPEGLTFDKPVIAKLALSKDAVSKISNSDNTFSIPEALQRSADGTISAPKTETTYRADDQSAAVEITLEHFSFVWVAEGPWNFGVGDRGGPDRVVGVPWMDRWMKVGNHSLKDAASFDVFAQAGSVIGTCAPFNVVVPPNAGRDVPVCAWTCKALDWRDYRLFAVVTGSHKGRKVWSTLFIWRRAHCVKDVIAMDSGPSDGTDGGTSGCATASEVGTRGSDMVFCKHNAPISQCEAKTTCAAGWHMCTATEYLAHEGATTPPPNLVPGFWLASCIRNGGALTAPSDASCSACDGTTGSSETWAWSCIDPTKPSPLSTDGIHLGVYASQGTRRVGVNTAGTCANWGATWASDTQYGVACCKGY